MSAQDPNCAETNSKNLVRIALKRVLGALTRLAIRYGVSFPEFAELTKDAYVREVKKSLELNNEKVTQSRISIVSGVHRKDVKRLTDEVDESSHLTTKHSITSRVLSIWLGDSGYLDPQGHPLELDRHGEKSFDTLVKQVSLDIRPRTLFDEWLRRGLLVEQPGAKLKLNLEALFPSDDLETKMSFFARNTADHISACEHNLDNTRSPFPERSVFYNRLSKQSVDELQKTAHEGSHSLLLALNKQAQQLAERDDQDTLNNHHRFILGTYFFREEESSLVSAQTAQDQKNA
ncbi:DUF6502 family protein [Marinomonas mediterranea]|jgi:hypothetical protein|uniref:Uncharacterized protein n=1 Tax=Marinomonas mediterranea (strain ATCC 700492 / JCM 21426 / NBRC 103028 / MMB-1) TaxID=717774 RepID=F2JXY0_MARM1|nr:DUF6502 family protein [Marinomonas mediterranea]ADZ89629.1 hypothetical protein Marme_0326 [Marinomonas mediterranea MMB-1]WCN07720.1 hypothetical protein GV055_01660 [Marinomonas mediterranea]WCN11821.1 hypothetical protein GV054_01685 [Marinomonas mediterranea]WCN15869.1 hypothetical protein GV053_01650 [Marinomonas mediterranea MMB-1]